MYDLCKISVIKELMADAGIALKKSYGQNFLINRSIPEDIADACADHSDYLILEIGPGIGCLTAELASRYAKVVAVEIDTGLIPVLGKTLADFDNVKVINEDIMQVTAYEELSLLHTPDRIRAYIKIEEGCVRRLNIWLYFGISLKILGNLSSDYSISCCCKFHFHFLSPKNPSKSITRVGFVSVFFDFPLKRQFFQDQFMM